jgi:drug/metabolite transporter (DMT)-like permease
MPPTVGGVKRSGALLCVTAAVILGCSVPVSRSVLGFPILTGQALRYALAALVLAVFVRRVLARPWVRLSRTDVVRLAALAATGLAGFNVCLLAALRHADPAVVGTVIGATPLVLAVLGPALQRRRPSVRVVAAASAVVAGAALVEGGGHADATGLAYSLGSLAGEAAFSLLAAPLLPRLGPVRVSAYGCALAVPLLACCAVATGEPARWRLPHPAELAAFGYLGLVLTALAFLAWYAGLARLGVERAGMCFGLMPVAALAATAVLDGRIPPLAQVAGVLVVGAGLAFGLTASRAQPPLPSVAGRSAARTASA